MLKKIVLAASAAAVVLGAGTAALATSGGGGSPTPSAPGAASAPAKPGAAAPGAPRRGSKADRPGLRAMGRALHAQWVTPDRDNKGAFVTHDAIRGAVTAVSATSITVKAADGVSQTYAVTKDTKVRLRKDIPGQGQGQGLGNGWRGNGHRHGGGTAGTIGDVHTGATVAVMGTGTSSLTAQHIVAVTG